MKHVKPGLVEALGFHFLGVNCRVNRGNALAIGLLIAGLVYAGAYISGAPLQRSALICVTYNADCLIKKKCLLIGFGK